LKTLRRGLQDRLLLRQLSDCGGGEVAKELVERAVPRALGAAKGSTTFPVSEPAWERLRGELLDKIEVFCHD
jgi:hypothetical protein